MSLFFCISFSQAQTPTIDLNSWNGISITDGAYYKDIDNYLDPFVGTWLYTNGNTSFKIVIEKKTMAEHPTYYDDLLLGGYQYIENGMEKINTIPMLANTQIEWSLSIVGNRVIDKYDKPECRACATTEKRVNLSFSDPERQLSGELILRRITVGGQAALRAFKRTTNYFISLTEESPFKFMVVPDGEYILIKQ